MGVVRTFQHVRLFREMTVIENLLVAQHQHLKSGVFAGLLKTPAFRRAEAESAGARGGVAGARRPAGDGQPFGGQRPMGSSGGWRSLAAW